MATNNIHRIAARAYPPAVLTSPSTLVGPTDAEYGHGTYVASASSSLGSSQAWHAFGGEATTWASAEDAYDAASGMPAASAPITAAIHAGQWLQLKVPSPVAMVGHRMRGPAAPTSFAVLGSNDGGESWTLLHEAAGLPATGGGEATFQVQAHVMTQQFTTFRLVVRGLAPGASRAQLAWGLAALGQQEVLAVLPTFLYLNPELAADSGVHTVVGAAAHFDPMLPHLLPARPAGFDARVYIAAHPNVSALNGTIKRAMMADGALDEDAVERRGVFVATLMAPARLVAANSFELSPGAGVALSSGNLGVADRIRMLRTRGSAFDAIVTSVEPPSRFTVAAVPPIVDGTTAYTMFGIKVYDPERQAWVALARSAAVEQDDLVPRPDFEVRTYQAVYPATRGFSFPDTYLDYRTKWRRETEFPIIRGKDIFNLSAPYSSNLLAAATTASTFSVSQQMIVGGGITMSPSNVMFFDPNLLLATRTDVMLGGGLARADPVVGTMDLGHSNLRVMRDSATLRTGITLADRSVVITPSNATFLSPVVMGPGRPLGAGDAKLAVSGDIYASGTLVTLSDARVKSDVRRIEGALERVAQLRGYTFDTLGGRRQTGLLAQELERVLPEAVFQSSSGDGVGGDGADGGPMRSVAYGNLAGLLVEAINGLAAKVQALEEAGSVGAARSKVGL